MYNGKIRAIQAIILSSCGSGLPTTHCALKNCTTHKAFHQKPASHELLCLKDRRRKICRGRPDFHGNTITHIKNFLRLESKLQKALDIACDTGLSTKALFAIATDVYGTDSSKAMIDIALQKDIINYQVAKAEAQPFADSSFDLNNCLFWLSKFFQYENEEKILYFGKRIKHLQHKK